MVRNIALYPWFKFLQSLSFWQATWFLYFESRLSAADAILLYVVYDVSTTVLEVPSGYMSDRLGRRITLVLSGFASVGACLLFVAGSDFGHFAAANVLLGAAAAFASGTDSSLLFESLAAEGRSAEIDRAELKAWRFTFTALAISAVTGGVLALEAGVLPYVATTASAIAALVVTFLFREPPRALRESHWDGLRELKESLTNPALLWLLFLSLAMYVFSHIPYLFGQPFIREAMQAAGYVSETPVISGAVTFTMMLVSLAVSTVALPVRRLMGMAGILLLAFGMQIALTRALAASNGLFVIGLLFFRMVPDSLSRPFMTARIQPLLKDGTRATYFSLQSLAGRMLFSLTLSLAAMQASDAASLPYSEIQAILSVYVATGIVFWLVLAATARRSGLIAPGPGSAGT
ncbi:MFS transporter [Sulfitobacter sp. LCG007]